MFKQIPSYLLAVVYLVFGLNFFLHFIPMPVPTGEVATYFGILFTTNYLLVVKILEISCAVLLFIPKTRALALLLIAPITVNILLYELLIAKAPGIGVILLLVNTLAIVFNKDSYMGIIKQSK